MIRSSIAVFVCVLGLALPASASDVFYDFGDELSAGNYNNITQVGAPIANSVDSTGAFTGIGLSVYDPFFPNDNPDGTQSPTGDASIFDPQATRDSLFGTTAYWNGPAVPTAGLLLTGLNPALTYDFTFFASRMGPTDNREAQYDVIGLTTGVDYLNPVGNVSEVAFVGGISPTAAGEITIDICAGPNNNNSIGFYYLGAIDMTIVPEPGTLGLFLLGGLVALRRR